MELGFTILNTSMAPLPIPDSIKATYWHMKYTRYTQYQAKKKIKQD